MKQTKIKEPKVTITHEYLHYQNKYSKMYGKDNTIVLMRVGDFYEAYQTNDDGFELSRLTEVVNLIKTKKYKDKEVSMTNPYMSGFNHVSLDKYIKLLIDNNFTVVVIDQVTPPPSPKRAVTGVYSAGTYIDTNAIYSNYVVCLNVEYEKQINNTTLTCIGLSAIDVSTGSCSVYETYSSPNDENYALDEAYRFILNYDPKEIIIIGNLDNNTTLISYLELERKKIHTITNVDKNFTRVAYQNEFFKKIYKSTSLLSPIEMIDMERMPYARLSFITLLDFIYKHDESFINNINTPEIFVGNKYLILGNDTIFQLNILENSMSESHGHKIKCLLDVINLATTPMGKRFMKHNICNPLNDPNEINMRYDCTEELINMKLNFDPILRSIIDIQKLARKIVSKTVSPHDFCSLVNSYIRVGELCDLVKGTKLNLKFLPNPEIIKMTSDFIDLCKHTFNFEELKKYNNISDIGTSIFNKGLYSEIDKFVDQVASNGLSMEEIAEYLTTFIDTVNEDDEVMINPKTGKAKKLPVTKIMVKSNKKLGKFLQLPKAKGEILKKRLANMEGDQIIISTAISIDKNKLMFDEIAKDATKIYFHDLTINSQNSKLLNDKLLNLVKRKYVDLLAFYNSSYFDMFKSVPLFVAKIDFINSNAKTAKAYNYCKPKLIKNMDNGYINAKQLRHPIVERLRTDVEYVAHDISMGCPPVENDCEILNGMLLYGSNSCGKSTLMKSMALNLIMAQTGLYVAADSYEYSPYENVFARIITNDNLYKNFSSFTYEMTELNSIIKRANKKTFIAGDEICNSTEHVSAISIVASTIINLAKKGSTFIFATHLHELANMEKILTLKTIGLYHLTAYYDKDRDVLVFDRLLKKTSGDSFYGLTVAKFIIKDNEFMKLAYEIKNDIMGEKNDILSTKSSRYHSEVYVDLCQLCGKKNTNSKYTGTLDTHHINFQKNCTEDGFVIGKNQKMHAKSNLIVLCKKCHHDVHHDKLKIHGYKDTSRGRIIDYEIL